MFTEAEAKSKLCPFIRHGESIHDVAAKTYPGQCIASECMAWRWSMTKEPLTPEQYLRSGMAQSLAYALQPTTYEIGYCGAAGAASGSPPNGVS